MLKCVRCFKILYFRAMNQLKLFNEVKRELTFDEYNKQVKAAQVKYNTSTYNSRAKDILKAYLKVERAKL